MTTDRRLSPLPVFFWLIAAASISILWRFMPSFWAQLGLLILLVIIIVSTLKRQTELPVLSTIFLAVTVVHYYQIGHPDSPLIGALIAFIIVPAIGLAGEKLNPTESPSDNHLVVGSWLVLGFIIAQMVSVFSYWPVSFFNRSLLTGTVFYTFWQLIIIQKTNEPKRYVTHFAFVGLTVIVIVGIILWVNFPQLISF